MRTMIVLLLVVILTQVAMLVTSCHSIRTAPPTQYPEARAPIDMMFARPAVMQTSLIETNERISATWTPGPGKYGSSGRFRVLRSLCDRPEGRGWPVVFPDYLNPPTVNRPCQIHWKTELLSPEAPLASYVFVSAGNPPPVDLSPVGFPGCVMHIDPNPRNLIVFTPVNGSFLVQIGGDMVLTWSPSVEFRGTELTAQAMFAVLNPNGVQWVWAPAVHMQVGG